MDYKDLTTDQKEFIHNKYEETRPELVDWALYEDEPVEEEPIDPFNGHEYVDMGEAGIWAKYPVGINQYDNNFLNNVLFFQWGDVVGYTANNKKTDWSSYIHGNASQLTKYCYDSKHGKDGFVDNLTVLLPEDDACRVHMGGKWRTPTAEDFQKLDSLCDTEYVKNYNGIPKLDGRLYTLKSDKSKQLFIGVTVYWENTNGGASSFWTSTISTAYNTSPNSAQYVYISTDYSCYLGLDSRSYSNCVLGILDTDE